MAVHPIIWCSSGINRFHFRLQRLDTDVIDAEAFERELRIQGAVTFRRSCGSKIGGRYKNMWTDADNLIADIVHKMWRKGINDTIDIIVEVNAKYLLQYSNSHIENVMKRMQKTDENLLNHPVPCLSREEQLLLTQYRDRDKKKTEKKSKFDTKKQRFRKSFQSSEPFQQQSYENQVNNNVSKKITTENTISETIDLNLSENFIMDDDLLLSDLMEDIYMPNQTSISTKKKRSNTPETDLKDRKKKKDNSTYNQNSKTTHEKISNTNASSYDFLANSRVGKTPGFINRNNNCYAISMFQLLYRLKPLVNLHLEYNGSNNCLNALRDWLSITSQSTTELHLDPSYYISLMHPHAFQPGEQQDAGEFLQYISHELLGFYSAEDHPEVFGHIEAIIHCNICQEDVSTTMQVEFPLPIQLPEQINPTTTYKISDLINSYQAEGGYLEYQCENCQQRYCCKRRYNIKKNSDYLLLSLIIGKHDPVTGNQMKRFPSVDVQLEISIEDTLYELVGFVSHITRDYNKGLNAGHYVANIMENGRRVTYDDSYCNINNEAHYVTRYLQRDQPYIIMYRKKHVR